MILKWRFRHGVSRETEKVPEDALTTGATIPKIQAAFDKEREECEKRSSTREQENQERSARKEEDRTKVK
jgi:hypothetical protein